MAEDILNANDVELVISVGGADVAGTEDFARLVADSFSVSYTQDNSTESGIGTNQPQGRSRGNVEYEFEMDLMGDNKQVFNNVLLSDTDGGIVTQDFDVTARITNDNGDVTREVLVKDASADEGDIFDLDAGDTAEQSISGTALEVDPDAAV